ncbi:MAG: hypothetical protein ACOH5I_05895 [Oligoflexus sp.]
MIKKMSLPFMPILCLLWTVQVEAANVRGIVKEKYISIDAGTNQGFVKKARVCFYDQGTRIACGLVVQAKEKRSFARVAEKNLKKIKKGLEVRLYESGSTTTASKSNTSTTEEKKQEEASNTEDNGASNLKLAYILTPQTPATYHAVSYFSPFDNNGDAAQVSTLWDRDRDIITSALGFGLELGLGIGSSKLTIGGRMRLYKGTTVKSFYDDDENNFAETRMTGSSVGAWSDFYYLSFDYGVLSIDIGNGIDLDISQVTMSMEQKSEVNDNTTKMYDYKSSLTIASLRTNILFNLYFGPMGLQFGSFFTIPLSSSGSPSVTVDDPQALTSLAEITPEEDVIEAVNHRAASFGIELFFSAYYAF